MLVRLFFWTHITLVRLNNSLLVFIFAPAGMLLTQMELLPAILTSRKMASITNHSGLTLAVMTELEIVVERLIARIFRVLLSKSNSSVTKSLRDQHVLSGSIKIFMGLAGCKKIALTRSMTKLVTLTILTANTVTDKQNSFLEKTLCTFMAHGMIAFQQNWNNISISILRQVSYYISDRDLLPEIIHTIKFTDIKRQKGAITNWTRNIFIDEELDKFNVRKLSPLRFGFFYFCIVSFGFRGSSGLRGGFFGFHFG